MSRYLLDTDIASCIIKGNSSAVARATRYGSNAKDRVWDSGGVAWKAGPPATAAGAATMPDEFGTHRVCATDRASAPQGISEVRSSLSRGTLRKELLTAGISIWRWPSPNSPIARACATSRPASARCAASCTTWVFAAATQHAQRAELTSAASSVYTGHPNRKQRVLLPETAAGIRFRQRLASENDLALVQFVRMG